jgi:hypothetical protein
MEKFVLVESVNNAIAFALFASGSTLILHGKKKRTEEAPESIDRSRKL